MTEKLKLCPFCGGTVKLRVNFANAQPVMHCKHCGSWTYFDETEKIKDGEKVAEAMIKAWNRRTEQAGWIKTSEQMPIAYNPILLYHRLYKEICIGYWRALTGLWWVFNYGVYSDEDVITHWMPLPELPEEEENEI